MHSYTDWDTEGELYVLRLRPYHSIFHTNIFLIQSVYTEKVVVEKLFISSLKKPSYGVIAALVQDLNFKLMGETSYNGIKCNEYKSAAGDTLFVHKIQLTDGEIGSSELYYLG